MVVNLELFVSLLFVVVIEIGAITRSLDLERISDEKLPPFFVGLFYLLDTGSTQRTVSIPQLGRFNFLHGANLAILFLGFILVTENSRGLTGLLIALITFVIWALLPLLEVDEYEEILIDGFRPVSYYHHVLLVSVSCLFVYTYGDVWLIVPYEPQVITKYGVLITVCVALYYVMLLGFLKNLERELDRENTNRLPDKITKTNPVER